MLKTSVQIQIWLIGDEVARGSGQNTKEITPPVAKIPQPITKEYIRAAWCKRDWVAVIEPLIDPTVAWSVAESQRIASGTPQQQVEYSEQYN